MLPQPDAIPNQRLVHANGAIGESMRRIEFKLSLDDMARDHATSGGTQVDRQINGLCHDLFAAEKGDK
jgi:hypothetical protein